MNTRLMVAALYAVIAALEATEDSAEQRPEAESKPRAKRVRHIPEYHAPLGAPSEMDRMRAKKMLRRRGIYS